MCRLALLVLALATAPLAVAAEPLDETLYARILERFTAEVSDPARTRVDYPALGRSEQWRQLIRNVGQTRPSELGTRDARLAYWINVYNIFAIDLVRVHRPEESIRDIGSFFRPVWKIAAGTIGDRDYSLDEIEHRTLVRHRDVKAFAARALELAHRGLEFLGRYLQQFVLHLLACLQREQSMDDGRSAVGHGIPDNAVAIDRYRRLDHSLSQRAAAIAL